MKMEFFCGNHYESYSNFSKSFSGNINFSKLNKQNTSIDEPHSEIVSKQLLRDQLKGYVSSPPPDEKYLTYYFPGGSFNVRSSYRSYLDQELIRNDLKDFFKIIFDIKIIGYEKYSGSKFNIKNFIKNELVSFEEKYSNKVWESKIINPSTFENILIHNESKIIEIGKEEYINQLVKLSISNR